jgi:hypothetical protein
MKGARATALNAVKVQARYVRLEYTFEPLHLILACVIFLLITSFGFENAMLI